MLDRKAISLRRIDAPQYRNARARQRSCPLAVQSAERYVGAAAARNLAPVHPRRLARIFRRGDLRQRAARDRRNDPHGLHERDGSFLYRLVAAPYGRMHAVAAMARCRHARRARADIVGPAVRNDRRHRLRKISQARARKSIEFRSLRAPSPSTISCASPKSCGSGHTWLRRSSDLRRHTAAPTEQLVRCSRHRARSSTPWSICMSARPRANSSRARKLFGTTVPSPISTKSAC